MNPLRVGRDSDRHVNSLRPGDRLAIGFHPGALAGLQRHLIKLASAFFGAAVLAWRRTGADGLLLNLALLLLGRFFGALHCLAFFNIGAHAFDVALSLPARGFGNGLVRPHRQRAAAARARHVGNLCLAILQATFVDFRTRREGKRKQQENGDEQSQHDLIIHQNLPLLASIPNFVIRYSMRPMTLFYLYVSALKLRNLLIGNIDSFIAKIG